MSTKDVGGDNHSPYKGTQSYQSEDAGLFFGRDLAADQIVAKVLSSSFCVLHAQTGAGKTSLLNARLIPGLELRGYRVITAKPETDPAKELKIALTSQLLPPLEAEAKAARRVISFLGSNGAASLEDAVQRCRSLNREDERRRELVAPVRIEASRTHPAHRSLPFLCRVLRGSIELDDYTEHLQAIYPPLVSEGQLCFDDISALAQILEAPECREARSALVEQLLGSSHTLVGYLQVLANVFASRHRAYRLIIVLDQFEELYTRFADPRHFVAKLAEPPIHWSVRDEFIRELEEAYKAGQQRESSIPPLRFLIALRSEYVSQLDALRRFAWSLDDDAVHLDLLRPDEAKEVMLEPARYFGYGYERACQDDLMTELAREEKFVQPAHLSIICEALWKKVGQKIRDVSPQNDRASELPKIPFAEYALLGGAKGILQSFINDSLAKFDDRARLEVLEILGGLVTPHRTRNIVELNQMVSGPLNIATYRRNLISELEKRAIVRIERRLGGQFLEITHDTLIPPIENAINSDQENSRFVDARRDLARVSAQPFRDDYRLLLTTSDLRSLHRHRKRIAWKWTSVEVMLRSAALADRREDDSASLTRYWFYVFCSAGVDGPIALPDNVTDVPDCADEGRAREAVDLLEAYATKPQLKEPERRAAMQALVDVALARTIQRLVGLALKEKFDMRSDAEQFVLGLRGEPADVATTQLTDALATEQRGKAYRLLGLWCENGRDLTLPHRRIASRLTTAHGAYKGLYTAKRAFSKRDAVAGLAGGLPGIAFTLVMFWLLLPSLGMVGLFSVLAASHLLITPLLVVAIARRAEGIQTHADQWAGALLEVGRCALSALLAIPVAAVFTVMLVLVGDERAWEIDAPLTPIYIWAGIIALAVVMRASSLVGYEAFSVSAARNRNIQWLCGSAGGLLLIWGALALWIMEYGHGTNLHLAEIACMGIPGVFGASRAMVLRDELTPPLRPIFGKGSKFGAAVLLGLTFIAAPLGLAVVGFSRPAGAPPSGFLRGKRDSTARDLDGPSLAKGGWRLATSSLGYQLRFRTSGGAFSFAASGYEVVATDLVLDLTKADGSPIAKADDPPHITADSLTGEYLLTVDVYRDGNELSSAVEKGADILAGRRPSPRAFQVVARDSRVDTLLDLVLAHDATDGPETFHEARIDSLVGAAESLLPEELHRLCMQLTDVGESTRALGPCHRAVSSAIASKYLESEVRNYQDSYAIALALAGRDTAVAIDAFTRYARATSSSRLKQLREEWITALREGRFTLEFYRSTLKR